MAAGNVTETQPKQSLATIQAAKAVAQAQMTQLETAKASYDQIIARCKVRILLQAKRSIGGAEERITANH